MYNQEFIDIIDKINSLAKSMNYTNGVAWARFALDNKMIDLYDYNEFENCHYLRNLMAHGHLRDINISSETMQIAKTFYSNIRNNQVEKSKMVPAQAPVQSTILQQEDRLKNMQLMVKEGDYVIAMLKEKHVRYPYSRERFEALSWHNKGKGKTYTIGEIFKVVGKDRMLQDLRYRKLHDIQELLPKYKDFFVFRYNSPVLQSQNPNARKIVYVVDEPQPFKDKNGQCKVHFKYEIVWYDNASAKHWSNTGTVAPEGYIAKAECFKKENPEPLDSGERLEVNTHLEVHEELPF